MGKKKKAVVVVPPTAAALARAARRTAREERKMARLVKSGKPGKPPKPAKTPKSAKSAKKEHRKRDRKAYTAENWALPAPSHLIARLEAPKHNSKYRSYFEFAENTEKRKKRLEFKVTNDSNPPPGFKFVPIGDPTLTSACKELSRERDAMIFIVSGSKEEKSKISEHIYRTGYHFRESIVDEAREAIGETSTSVAGDISRKAEPIPESQDEINKQADDAIRDLFPRIPNTDRQIIIEHAFQKGAMFHGEPTVGLQASIPLSRRVQLAVLAHIRHTHTRYDQLLRETSWINARKVVEPVCLDVLVKWRGDEETGRDQMDEILREVVIITDSEESDESSEEDDSSDEDGEVTSSSTESISQPAPNTLNRSTLPQAQVAVPGIINQRHEIRDREPIAPGVAVSSPGHDSKSHRHKKTQRGFKRYQAAWDDAVHRHQAPESAAPNTRFEDPMVRRRQLGIVSPVQNHNEYTAPTTSEYRAPPYNAPEQGHYADLNDYRRPDPSYVQKRTAPGIFLDRGEVIARPPAERLAYYQGVSPRPGAPPQHPREHRLPPMVRGPPSHGLQDMLVPSIETGSSDALVEPSRPDMRREIYPDFDQASYPRHVVERRRQSPEPHQVIVINDSPQPKRRRVVHDDPGHFRPLPFRDHMVYSTAPHAESHLIPASSTQPRDFLAQNPRNPGQLSQGFVRDTQQSLTRPSGERIPIYDVPAEASYNAAVPSRRVDFGVGPGHQREVPRRLINSPRPLPDENLYLRRPAAEDAAERGHDFSPRNRTQRQSPNFPISNRVSHSYGMGPEPVYADQSSIHNFSESRFDPPLSRTRDGINLVPERPRQNFAGQGNIPQRFEDQPARTFTTVSHAQGRSPEQDGARPMYRREHLHEPMLYEHDRPYPLEGYNTADRPLTVIRERPPPQPRNGSPTFVRTVPRREVITLE